MTVYFFLTWRRHSPPRFETYIALCPGLASSAILAHSHRRLKTLG